VEASMEGTLEGTEGEKHLWVRAYLNPFYDAGASADASGLVSILSAAGALQQLNLVDTVHLVACDLGGLRPYGEGRRLDREHPLRGKRRERASSGVRRGGDRRETSQRHGG
jgi:hypothetical protein